MELQASLKDKLSKLEAIFRDMKRAAIAFSGGVDSSLLLFVAQRTLGSNAIALTAQSETFPLHEQKEALQFCRSLGVRQIVIQSSELNTDAFRNNPPDRCYLCKKHLFSSFLAAAQEEGISWLCEGSNMDDLGDYRPGLRAIAELGIRSPLREAELTKAEIRELSRYFDLPTWDKPSYACLASRFVYGEAITAEKLCMVGKGEEYLMGLGFRQMRVRIHGTLARIELLPEDMEKAMEPNLRMQIAAEFRKYGFSYVTMDLTGYRTGSMNEILKKETPSE